MPYELSLDLGTNSIGWAILDLNDGYEPYAIQASGVRIFSDGRNPKDGTTLCERRRLKRSERRRRDRFIKRRESLIKTLISFGIWPVEEQERKKLEKIDPYFLRYKGIKEKLTLEEFGRAIFHLNQRRGFKSNRKTPVQDDKEAKLIDNGVKYLAKKMEETSSCTYGEFLYNIRSSSKGIRIREGVDFYPSREILEAEFDQLFKTQSQYYPNILTPIVRDTLRSKIFYQRPLRPVNPGRCAFDPTIFRGAKAHPLFQRFRMWTEINNLQYSQDFGMPIQLTLEQKKLIFAHLERKGKLSFKSILKLLGIKNGHINLEAGGREELLGDQTGIALVKVFGESWWTFEDAFRIEVVETLLQENETILIETAQKWNFNPDQIQALLETQLPQGYSNLGISTIQKILPYLEKGLSNYDACVQAGYQPLGSPPTERLTELPFYSELPALRGYLGLNDQIANPTVHIALNQLRRVVNAIIAEYGAPFRVIIEVTRELKHTRKQKERISKRQNNNRKINEDATDLFRRLGIADNSANRFRYRLWREIPNPICVYTGEAIDERMLFSPEIEIDHLIPYADSLDDSISNCVLVKREANRDKRKRTPYDAFKDSQKYNWKEICKRVKVLAEISSQWESRAWRFDPKETAVSLVQSENQEYKLQPKDFLARQITDTAYIAKVARLYLQHITDPNQVYTVPGTLTVMFRYRWNLNSLLDNEIGTEKNRKDHRHHAIDAIVIGCLTRSMLHKVSLAAKKSSSHLIDVMPEPWPHFRQHVKEGLNQIQVSHKMDHGDNGQLFKETALGIVSEEDNLFVYRKPFLDLKEGDLDYIRGPIKAKIKEALRSNSDLKTILMALAKQEGIRRIRLYTRKNEVSRVRIVKHGKNKQYVKAYAIGESHHLRILEKDKRWIGQRIEYSDWNESLKKKSLIPIPSGYEVVMELFQGDTISITKDGKDLLLLVKSFTETGIQCAETHVAGKSHDIRESLSFNQMKRYNAQKVFVHPLGVERRQEVSSSPNQTLTFFNGMNCEIMNSVLNEELGLSLAK